MLRDWTHHLHKDACTKKIARGLVEHQQLNLRANLEQEKIRTPPEDAFQPRQSDIDFEPFAQPTIL